MSGRKHLSVAYVSIRVEVAQRFQCGTPLYTMLMTVVSRVFYSYPHAERQISQTYRRCISRMTGAHQCRSPTVGHTRCHTECTVAACRITRNVYFIGINAHNYNSRLDKFIEETVKIRKTPHIPNVMKRTRSYVHSLFGLIKPYLIIPLSVVYLRCSSTAAMHRDVKRTSVGWLLAINTIHKLHGQRVSTEGLFFPDFIETLMLMTIVLILQ